MVQARKWGQSARPPLDRGTSDRAEGGAACPHHLATFYSHLSSARGEKTVKPLERAISSTLLPQFLWVVGRERSR